MKNKIQFLLKNPTLNRYIRFGIVGASGIAVDMVALFLLSDHRMLGLDLHQGRRWLPR